jgi:hypothetical protein
MFPPPPRIPIEQLINVPRVIYRPHIPANYFRANPGIVATLAGVCRLNSELALCPLRFVMVELPQ